MVAYCGNLWRSNVVPNTPFPFGSLLWRNIWEGRGCTDDWTGVPSQTTRGCPLHPFVWDIWFGRPVKIEMLVNTLVGHGRDSQSQSGSKLVTSWSTGGPLKVHWTSDGPHGSARAQGPLVVHMVHLRSTWSVHKVLNGQVFTNGHKPVNLNLTPNSLCIQISKSSSTILRRLCVALVGHVQPPAHQINIRYSFLLKP